MSPTPVPLALRLLLIRLLVCLLPSAAVAATPTVGAVPEVVAAVRFAYGLEDAYWADPAAFRGWNDIYAHYRQGFSPDIAEAMTEYTLTSDGDPATWVPERVEVAELEPSHALVWFPTPAAFGRNGLWDMEDYTLVRLRRDGSGWIVYWAEDRPTPPVR